MELKAATLDEHREYLYEIVKLKLNFLFKYMKRHPDEKFENVLRNRVDIYRKCSANRGLLNPTEFFWDVEPWIIMEKASAALYSNCKTPDEFERQAFEVFRRSIDERVEKDFHDKSGLDGYQCGSLRYNLSMNQENCSVGFHIANAIRPYSIFADKKYLPNCLLNLCDQVEEKFGAEYLSTETWLNSFPKWVALFPEEWRQNMGEENRNVQWHYGFWGQFISSRGTFNYKYGKILRESSEMPFYPRYSFCRIAALREHLHKIL